MIDGASTQLCIISIGFKRVLQRLLTAFIKSFFFLSFFGPVLPPLPCHCLQGGAIQRWRFFAAVQKQKKNLPKTVERADVWPSCSPVGFDLLVSCFFFVLFKENNSCAKLTCSPVAVQPHAPPTHHPLFRDFKAEASALLAVSVWFSSFFLQFPKIRGRLFFLFFFCKVN